MKRFKIKYKRCKCILISKIGSVGIFRRYVCLYVIFSSLYRDVAATFVFVFI